MFMITTALDRVKAALAEQHKTEAGLAKALEITAQAVSNWSQRGTLPPRQVKNIASYLGVTTDWLLTGDNSDKSVPPKGSKVNAWDSLEDLPGEGALYRFMPVYDIVILGHPGQTKLEWVERGDDERVAISRSFFTTRKLDADRCRAVYVRGDAMSPGLKDGDTALFDLSVSDAGFSGVRDGYIYLVEHYFSIYIRRLYTLPQGLEIRSDNSDHKDFVAINEDFMELTILGKMVWRAG